MDAHQAVVTWLADAVELVGHALLQAANVVAHEVQIYGSKAIHVPVDGYMIT